MRKIAVVVIALALGWSLALAIDTAASEQRLRPVAVGTSAQYVVPEESLAPVVAYLEAVQHAQVVEYLTAIAPRPARSSSRASSGGCTEEEIIARESKGDPRAVNSRSGAAGLYQILDSTWAGREGVTSAADASPEAQRQAYTEIRASNPRAWAASGC